MRSGAGIPRFFRLESIDRFDWHPDDDGGYCVLLMKDGGEVRVRSVAEDRPGDVALLNNRLLQAQRDATP